MPSSWGTCGASHSREELIKLLDSLLASDKAKTRIGWDYPRAINLCRWGVDADYLTDAEAWDESWQARAVSSRPTRPDGRFGNALTPSQAREAIQRIESYAGVSAA